LGVSARGVVRVGDGGAISGEGVVPADEDGLVRLVLAVGPEVRACVEMMSGAVWVRDLSSTSQRNDSLTQLRRAIARLFDRFAEELSDKEDVVRRNRSRRVRLDWLELDAPSSDGQEYSLSARLGHRELRSLMVVLAARLATISNGRGAAGPAARGRSLPRPGAPSDTSTPPAGRTESGVHHLA
jgi:hypothetical protein